MKKNREIELFDFWCAWHDPPPPHLKWSKDAIKKYLVENGFELNKEIFSKRPYPYNRTVYWQEEE